MQSFVHLHVHTEYSLLDGAGRVGELTRRAAELGMDALAITDHGVMYGAVEFYKACKRDGIKPVMGCEVYVAPRSMRDMEGRADREYAHLILLAENNMGYQNLMELVSLGFLEGFYYRPRIDYQTLRKFSGGLIALTACLSGDIPRLLLRNDFEGACTHARMLHDIMGQGNLFIEMQDHGLTDEKRITQDLIKICEQTGIPPVATNDVHYVHAEDAQAQDVLMCIQTGKTVDDENRMRMHSNQFYLKSPEEMHALYPHCAEALHNTVEIARRCDVTLEFGKRYFPGFDVPEGVTPYEMLQSLCEEGAAARFGEIEGEVRGRLDYELQSIRDMGFVDYFLIVWDFIRFAKSKGIMVGPGRGSAAGSLVAYCLGITNVNPLAYGLIFERFLNPERISMPDIDIDFCYERRQEVIDYVVDKYGADRVAQIITFGTMATRAVIRDVGRALDIPYAEVDRIAKMVPFDLHMTMDKALSSSAELRRLVEENDMVRQLIELGKKLEGLPRHASTHAAGVVISSDKLIRLVPLQKNDDVVTTQFAMGNIEEIGLLKMDFLGLRTLTVLRDALEFIREHRGVTLDLDTLPFDDAKVYQMIGQGDTDGVFQLESGGMRQFMRELLPTTFEDIIAGISLYRPGPMREIPRYVAGKRDPQSVHYAHPLLKNILDVTYGCMVYQEQVMQIVRELAGYSMARSDVVRRAMSKKKADVMQKERAAFVEGCAQRGIDAGVSNSIYDQMMDFAQYAFNKSHAAAYGVLAYQTAYLKCHYPVEFLCALLNSYAGNSVKVAQIISYCKRRDIAVLPPDINRSEYRFSVEDGAIRFGLMFIKNLGQQATQHMAEVRVQKGVYKDFFDFIHKIGPENANKRMLESLIKSGCFDALGHTRSSLLSTYEKILDAQSKARRDNLDGQVSLFDSLGDTQAVPAGFMEALPDLPEFDFRQKLAMEKETAGVYISGHPLQSYQQTLEAMSFNTSVLMEGPQADVQLDNARVQMGGIIVSKRTQLTRANQLMAYAVLEDLYGQIEILIFPRVLEQYTELIQMDNVIKARGRLNMREDKEPVLVLESVEPLKEIVNDTPDQKQHKLFLRCNTRSQITGALPLLREHPGKTPVVIFMADTREQKLVSRDCFVNVNDVLLQALRGRYGEENVRVT